MCVSLERDSSLAFFQEKTVWQSSRRQQYGSLVGDSSLKGNSSTKVW